MEPEPSQADPVDTKFKRPELVSRPREPNPPAGGSAGVLGGVSEALEGANGRRSADPCLGVAGLRGPQLRVRRRLGGLPGGFGPARAA